MESRPGELRAQQIAVLKPGCIEIGALEFRVPKVTAPEPGLVQACKRKVGAVPGGSIGEHAVVEDRLPRIGMGERATDKPAVEKSGACQIGVGKDAITDGAVIEYMVAEIGPAPVWTFEGLIGRGGGNGRGHFASQATGVVIGLTITTISSNPTLTPPA